MKRILVPTDFSACADNAVNFAIQSAKMLPAEVIVIHAFELKGNIYSDYMGVNKEFNQSLLENVHNKLKMVKSAIEQTEGFSVETEVYIDSVENSIIQASVEKNVDYIVMGTSGASGVKEKLFGSKTASLIGKSQVPVIAIPTDYVWRKPEKILLATNHFEEEPGILDFLFEMADLYMAQVEATVFTDTEDDKAVTFLEHTRKAPKYEKMLKENYKEDTLTVAHLYGTDFEETIQDYIRKDHIDMLAMIPYHKKLRERIFHPSMTKRMSYHTTIPLLAIPAKGK